MTISVNLGKEHITVCICTYKRPKLLRNLLERILIQETDNLFSISVSVVDNDMELSAKPVIDEFLRNNNFEIVYAHNPDKNLALLRNISGRNSRGDYVAFIDDDEFPVDNWLVLLYKTIHSFRVDGALGPVLPKYQLSPPRWVEKGKLCERMRFKTGHHLEWWQTRTGNALVKRSLLMDPDNAFELKFELGGEDDAFFHKLMNKGFKFVWCDEAVVYEEIPARRLTLAYFLRRSQLIGFMSYSYYKDTRTWLGNTSFLLKSCAAFIIYPMLMPIYLACGYHHFAKLLIRYHYHKAVILSCLGAMKLKTRNI